MPKRKSAKESEACCYCCCILVIIIIVIGIIVLIARYWYISLPVIAGILIFAYIYQQQQRKKLVHLLDTIPNQKEYKNFTGYDAIENEQFTDKYKAWLLKKAGVSTFKLFTKPKIDSIKISQPQYYPPQYEQKIKEPQEQLEQKTKFCPYCGSKNKIEAKHCTSCGNLMD